jgi:hypothetical protein
VQHKKATWIDKTAPVQHKKDSLDIKKQYQCNIKKTTCIDKRVPVQHKKATWIDKTVPVQHKNDSLDR